MPGLVSAQVAALYPPLDVKGDTEAARIVTRGPIQQTPRTYPADNCTQSQLLWQNIMPPLGVIMNRQVFIEYEILVGIRFGYVRTAAGAGSSTETWTLPLGMTYPDCDQQAGTSVYSWTRTGTDLPEVAEKIPFWQFRSLPLMNGVQTAEIKINGGSVTTPCSQLATLHALMSDPRFMSGWMTTYPFGHDCSFSPAALARQHPFSGLGSSNQGVASKTMLPSRGAMTQLTLVYSAQSANSQSADVAGCIAHRDFIWKAAISEPLVATPFTFGSTFEQPGLTHITSLTVQLTLENLLRSIQLSGYFSIQAPGVPAGQIAGSMFLVGNPYVVLGTGQTSFIQFQPIPAGQYVTTSPPPRDLGAPAQAAPIYGKIPNLNFMFSTPDPITQGQIPPYTRSSTEQLQLFQKVVTLDPTKMAPGTSQQVIMNSYTMGNVPSKVMLFCVPDNATQRLANLRTTPPQDIAYFSTDPLNGYQLNDYALNIKNVNMSIISRVGVLSTMSEVDLYRANFANGIRVSFDEWRHSVGGFLALDMAVDINVGTSESAGQSIQTTFMTTVEVAADIWSYTVQPAGCFPLNYILYLVGVTPCNLILGVNTCQILIDGPTGVQVRSLLSETTPKTYPHEFRTQAETPETQATQGGNFGKHFTGKGGMRALDYLHNHQAGFHGLVSGALNAITPQEEGAGFKRGRGGDYTFA